MPVVAVEDLWKYFGDYPALRKISLSVEPGCCMAVLGRNGAGKTTLLRILSGLSSPAQGAVNILGRPSRDPETRARVGIIGHGIGIYDELTAIENLRLFGELYGVPDPGAAAREWLEKTGLGHVMDGTAREFSRGMRQRLAVARAFLHNPQVFLMDEPFTSLDDRAIDMLQSLLREALAEGRSILMSTHQLREALELATHVALLNRGRLVYTGERSDAMLADPGWLYRNYGEA